MNNNIVIGKYTLESLTNGMYVDPFIIFREYIQNSADGIDDAVKLGILSYEESRINIIIDNENKVIRIEDNGIGIKSIDAYKILTDIGNSNKKTYTHKGFRGIGRLGGLSYCDKIIFETSYKGEPQKTNITFDSSKLTHLFTLDKYNDYTMTDVIRMITSENHGDEESEKHYFKVKLINIKGSDKLCNIGKVEYYLKQIAPIPFDTKKFKYANIINSKMSELKLTNNIYNIYIGKGSRRMKKLLKPYKVKFYSDNKKKIIDNVTAVKIKVIRNDYLKKIVAVVWYSECNLFGTILDEDIKGLRLKKAGLLVGDRFTLNKIFKEERFNGWIQGEVLIFDEDIIPNARRDNFEENDAYKFLIEKLKEVADEISNEIRSASRTRNKQKLKQGNKEINKDNLITQNTEKGDGNFHDGYLLTKLDEFINVANFDKVNLYNQISKIIKCNVENKNAEVILNKIRELIS